VILQTFPITWKLSVTCIMSK